MLIPNKACPQEVPNWVEDIVRTNKALLSNLEPSRRLFTKKRGKPKIEPVNYFYYLKLDFLLELSNYQYSHNNLNLNKNSEFFNRVPFEQVCSDLLKVRFQGQL